MGETVEKARTEGLCGRKFGRLCRIWHIITREPKTPEGDPCVRFPGHIIRKPDPCIYSQFLLMQLDQPVTWDNPDVGIFLDGVEQYTYNLTADTEYTLRITVHNSSRDKPALGTTVHVRWVEFGAGGRVRHTIDSLSADVPVWPGTTTVTTAWRTPATPGHYCIEVELHHPDDGNPANNRGWNNTQVHAASSPVHRPIRVFNQYPDGCPPVREGGGPRLRPERVFWGWGTMGAVAGGFLFAVGPEAWDPLLRLLALVAAGYVLLSLLGLLGESVYAWIKRGRRARDAKGRDDVQPLSCRLVEIGVDSYEFDDDVGKDFDPAVAFQGKAAIWNARVEPPSFLFADGEVSRDVELIVDAPDDPGPPGVFNVSVRQGGLPSGGATVTVTRGGS